MTGSPRSVESSVRVYEVLIKAYPASFRSEYGNEMTLVFREQITDAWRQRGAVGLIAAWFRVLADLARTAPEEHFVEMQRKSEMKNAAMAIGSVVVAGLAYSAIFYGGAFIVILPLIAGMVGRVHHSVMEFAMLVIVYLAAFLAGMILTCVKSLVRPVVTVPLGTMAMCGIWGLGTFLESASRGHLPTWAALALGVGFGASVGLAVLAGCLVAKRASSRLARLSVPWYQLVGPLAVLVCTSFVASVLQLALAYHQLESDLRLVLGWCLFALVIIAAATIASLVLLVVGTYQRNGSPAIGPASPCDEPLPLP